MPAHQRKIMQHGDHRPPFALPARHQPDEVAHRLLVDRGKRLVEQHQRRILQQYPRKQRALHLPAAQRIDRPACKAVEPHRAQRACRSPRDPSPENPPNSPCRFHSPSPTSSLHRGGKAAVDLGALRQIGDGAGRARDGAAERLQHAHDALHQRRLARAVRPDDRRQRAAVEGAVEMVHRRMPVIAERQIVEARPPRSQQPPQHHPQHGRQPERHRHARGSAPLRKAQLLILRGFGRRGCN